MKKIIFLCLVGTITVTAIFAAQKPLVSGKALKVFHEAFPEVQQSTSYTFKCSSNYIAKFSNKVFKADNTPLQIASGSGAYHTGQHHSLDGSNFHGAYLTKKIADAAEPSDIGPESVNKKVLKHFNRKFKAEPTVKWEQLNDKFLATFLNGETITKILFDEKGKLIYTISYSSGKLLPPGIMSLVKSKYEKYKITSVSKIDEDNRQMWIVKLAGKNNFITATVEDDELAEIENFQRAN